MNQRGRIGNLFTCAVILASCAFASLAEVRLPGIFSNNMVLQRGKPIAVWGWAEEGEQVTVKLLDHTASTTATNGKWKVFLPEVRAGGPYKLSVQDSRRTTTLENVLVGEVWVCSGQSNMEWGLASTFEPQVTINSATNSKVRLFTVPRVKAEKPMDDVKASWAQSSPETVKHFSAVAYYFGRALQKKLNVPVGLIHTSWGGSPAEVWMREEVLAENAAYKKEILDPAMAQLERHKEAVANWQKEKEELEKEGKKITRGQPSMWRPSELYNGMIAPLLPYSIAGAIWYQGESNAGRAHQYRELFADMIANWRIDFGQGDFPFLAVQLAPWDKNRKREMSAITAKPEESDWAELREAQNYAAKVLPNTAVVVITDVGDKDDIHPVKKEPVGERLALAARKIAYNENITWSGPLYRELEIRGDKAILSFDHLGKGLQARDGDLTGFAIAGKDRKFFWADAAIKGDKVVVSSPEVPEPVAVRYGWSDYPVVNLWNKNGLPASPFRTDNFPMSTGPRR